MRKSFTRIAGVLVAMPLALSLAACGSQDTAVEPGAAATAVDEGSSAAGDTSKDAPAAEAKPAAPAEPAEVGTRENPATPGVDVMTVSSFDQPEWEISLGAATLDANAVVAAENQFNEAPPAGSQYVMLPVTATYKGAETGTPAWDITVKLVTADGRSFEQAYVVIPTPLSDVSELYAGGVGTGNLVFAVPSDAIAGATWAVEVGFGNDPLFFKVI